MPSPSTSAPVGMLGDVFFVRDHDDGAALVVQPVEELQDLGRGREVEVAGGLVDEQHFGVADERPGDGHALHLAAGELIGVMVGAVGQADPPSASRARRRRSERFTPR